MRLFVVLAACGCATAGRETPTGVGDRPDGGPTGTNKDAGTIVVVDAAPLPDAPPGQQTKTLSQTNNNTVAVGAAIACGYNDPFFGTIATADNSWYRVFRLADHGINNTFTVQRVSFMVDFAWAGTGTSQPAAVKVGTYAGTLEANTLNTAQMTTLATANIMIPDGDAMMSVPPPVVTDITATIPAGSNLLVEIALPDGRSAGNYFYIGVSSGGETKKGYIRATPSGCNFTSPTSLVGQLNRPDNAVLLTVTGTH